MKIRATQIRLTSEQRNTLKMDSNYDPEWQITINSEYIVFSLVCMHTYGLYGNSTLYTIIDDYGKLLPAPACLFEIIDPRPSLYWIAEYKDYFFSLNPEEFIKDPYLTESILDREVTSIALFKDLQRKFENEFE